MSIQKIFHDSLEIKTLRKKINDSNDKIINCSPFAGSAKALFVKSLAEDFKQLVVLLSGVQQLNELKVELDILGLNKVLIPFDELKPEQLQEKLAKLTDKQNCIIIAPYDLLALVLPAQNQLEKNTTMIQIGSNLGYNELIEYLNLLNYQKNKFVESVGDYTVRGSIIDFWSYSESNPCRIEFDGDFIESIRHFDADSQRSADKVERVSLTSSFELLDENFSSNIFDYLDNPLVIAERYDLNSFFNGKADLPTSDVQESIIEDEELSEELLGDRKNIIAAVTEKEEKNLLVNEIDSDKLFNRNAKWLIEDPFTDPQSEYSLSISEPPTINSNYEFLFNTIKDFTERNFKIVITSENEFQSKRLRDLLSDFKEELAALIEIGKVQIETLALKKGFVLKKEQTLVLTDYQIFNKPYRTKIPSRQIQKRSRTKDLASLKRGDFIVHENFGIGQYAGLETIKIGDISQESIKILYAEGGVVFVNLNYFHLVKKYSSKEGETPRLAQLGSGEWDSTKKKVKKKIKEAARELITLYAKRKAAKGYSFQPDTIWQKELEASFFYEDTPDQAKVSEEVKTDMESESPMDRLVCGDVGFGKTEIAVRAAFKSVSDGKQTALLVPTTILAEQHYNTFKDRLTQFPVKIEAMSRFQTKTKQKEIVKDLSEGKVDIVIGTHRLLSKDIQFKDLGLLIIDEEHRFGVMAKEKLKNFKLNVDTLTLTATPIPRTLNLSLLGARDLSLIATPPPNRQPIYTLVHTFEISKVREWILVEVRRGGQVYFIHDRVQSISKIAEYLKKYLPEIKFGVAHGQMKPLQLENVIYDFLNKKFDVLICTKIIESGMDIPNVNTIIINRADRFGLAELHQLRGRVGRSDRQAYAYLLVPTLDAINKKAVRRLAAIEEFTDVGAGFNLSMRDLEIRGAGNLLGTEQSGFIDAVGFDMYVKLLDEAVEELKRLEFAEVFKELPKHKSKTDPTIDTYFEIGIPKAFMPDQADRLSFYTALFSIKALEDAKEITDEIRDRFGKLPLLVERLVATAILKYYASYALFERIIIHQKNITIILPKGTNEEFYKEKFTLLMNFVMENYFNEIKFTQQKETLKLIIQNKFESPEKVFDYLFEFCRKVEKIVNV